VVEGEAVNRLVPGTDRLGQVPLEDLLDPLGLEPGVAQIVGRLAVNADGVLADPDATTG